MASHQSDKQKQIIERVMHEFKEGELKIRGNGPKVTNPKQAIAIALHEAGASNEESPAKNRKNLRKTSAREKGKGAKGRSSESGPTKAALYEEVRQRKIPGRSSMSKSELERALAH